MRLRFFLAFIFLQSKGYAHVEILPSSQQSCQVIFRSLLLCSISRGLLTSNPIQGYLKGLKENVDCHITLAAKEDWDLSVNLVQGAYIEHEDRLICAQKKILIVPTLTANNSICQRLPDDAKRSEAFSYCTFSCYT